MHKIHTESHITLHFSSHVVMCRWYVKVPHTSITILQYITRILSICWFISVRIFLFVLRCLFRYLSSFILTFLTLYVCIFTHIIHIVMLYFRTHLNMILHIYFSIYYEVYCRCICNICFSHISLYFIVFTHISYCFILTSHSFCQNLFCNTCIAYVYVSHTFGFDFLFSKAEASHTFVRYLLKILEYK